MRLVPENQADSLFYLTFKTSSADTLVKYIFGDIYFSLDAKVKNKGDIEVMENGFYRLTNENAYGVYKNSSFQRAKVDFEKLKKGFLEKGQSESDSNFLDNWIIKHFRDSFSKDENFIEKILRNIPALEKYFQNDKSIGLTEFLENEAILDQYFIEQVLNKTSKKNLKKVFGEDFDVEDKSIDDLSKAEKEKLKQLGSGQIFLHFDFDGKHWYEFSNDLDIITEQMLNTFFEKTEKGLAPHKMLYKNLCTGNKKNDAQFPGFISLSKYKSKYFTPKDAKNLFYAKEYSERRLLTIRGTDIYMIVLPRGKNLNANDYSEFSEKANEKRMLARNQRDNDEDPLLIPLSINENNNITAFDFIFSKFNSS
ncbi:MAG: hypothetical protein ABEH43_05870, partial [Flavobacteriales bacterium]